MKHWLELLVRTARRNVLASRGATEPNGYCAEIASTITVALRTLGLPAETVYGSVLDHRGVQHPHFWTVLGGPAGLVVDGSADQFAGFEEVIIAPMSETSTHVMRGVAPPAIAIAATGAL